MLSSFLGSAEGIKATNGAGCWSIGLTCADSRLLAILVRAWDWFECVWMNIRQEDLNLKISHMATTTMTPKNILGMLTDDTEKLTNPYWWLECELPMLESFNFVYLGCQPITEGVLGQLSLGEPEQICIQVRQFLGPKLFIFSTNIREATLWRSCNVCANRKNIARKFKVHYM